MQKATFGYQYRCYWLLLVVTVILTIVFYLAEHRAQPEEYRTPLDALVWASPRDFVDAGIPKGYMIQVVSSSTGGPHGYEIAEALRRAGFNKRTESWSSPGNWIIK